MPYREMYSFSRLLVQLPQVRQAQAPDIELSGRRLPDRETCDSQVMDTFSVAIQESGCDKVRKEAMNRAHWQPGKASYLFGGQPARRFAEEMEKAQSALKGSDVIVAFRAWGHSDQQK